MVSSCTHRPVQRLRHYWKEVRPCLLKVPARAGEKAAIPRCMHSSRRPRTGPLLPAPLRLAGGGRVGRNKEDTKARYCTRKVHSKISGMPACSVLTDSSQAHGLQPTQLPCPRNSLGKNTGVGCHFLLWVIFPTQRSNPHLLYFLPWQEDFYQCSTWEACHTLCINKNCNQLT